MGVPINVGMSIAKVGVVSGRRVQGCQEGGRVRRGSEGMFVGIGYER